MRYAASMDMPSATAREPTPHQPEEHCCGSQMRSSRSCGCIRRKDSSHSQHECLFAVGTSKIGLVWLTPQCSHHLWLHSRIIPHQFLGLPSQFDQSNGRLAESLFPQELLVTHWCPPALAPLIEVHQFAKAQCHQS
mmetsp:Transcript_24497/g.47028  ORF Transcript_24497/g.47028 Transcript_24497/m.47028 type:complete len:136 (+) Transcript_24497:280-687(+)